MDSKEDGAANRETLKFREMVEIEEAFYHAQSGRLEIARERLDAAVPPFGQRKAKPRRSRIRRGTSRDSQGSADEINVTTLQIRKSHSYAHRRRHSGREEASVPRLDPARDKERWNASRVYSFVVHHDQYVNTCSNNRCGLLSQLTLLCSYCERPKVAPRIYRTLRQLSARGVHGSRFLPVDKWRHSKVRSTAE